MSNPNSYIVFEPDQVLTNDHLNELFDYLDTQERLTRNKLIGIGIVCGLEISFDAAEPSISISRGCGVTSKGYLIVGQEEDDILEQVVNLPLRRFSNYTLPANPLYKPFVNTGTGKQFNLWLLLNDEQAKASEVPVQLLTAFPGVLDDMVVVLFLEAVETDLKNCDTQDCNEKGRKMEFAVRPLLVHKKDMDTIISTQKKQAGDDDGLSSSYIERLGLKDVALRRFDVTATSVSDAYDIFNGYAQCLDDALLKSISEVYSQSYSVFKPVLDDYPVNPFTDFYDFLKQRLAYIQQSLPVYIQYYYDFVDDLLKAYNEFRDRSFEVITECCPDEDLFPMHLMLGEATVNTSAHIRSPYRQYFIYSPLFNNQSALLGEVKLLFKRMVELRNNFFIRYFDGRTLPPVRVTPSKWGDEPLSGRAIPYYYNINPVAQSWNYQKTRKGKANHNLSYNAASHVPAPPAHIVNPLQYGIEQYDFYRIEGHIGQSWDVVLKSITDTKNFNRLPFDVIALKAGDDASNTFAQADCNFQDLQAMYEIIKSELACKAHEPVCLAAKTPSSLTQPGSTGGFNFLNTFTSVYSLALTEQINRTSLFNTKFVYTYFSTKGAFLKANCPVAKNTLGEEYSNSVRKSFPRPSKIELGTTAGAKAALLHLIDTVEELMLTVKDTNLYYFKFDDFKAQYDETISYLKDFSKALLDSDNERKLSPFLYDTLESVIYSCVDKKLKALVDEYNERVNRIKKMNLLSEYIVANPGIDHKAGVPRGGTFILVYYEVPPQQTSVGLTTLSANIAALNTAASTTLTRAADDTSKTPALAEASLISANNMNEILKLFENKELKLSAEQASKLKSLAVSRFNSLVGLREQFRIPDKAVIADFYLPYLCCSDCAPVTYVFPKEDVAKLAITISKTEFCNNDENTYPVTVNPAGGTLSDTAGGIKQNSLVFAPKGLAAGIDKITYALADGRSTSVDVKISAPPVADFTSVIPKPLTVVFTATGIEGKTISWNFGDDATSTSPNPTHTYQFDGEEKTFTVRLSVSDGPCTTVVEHAILLTKPRRQVFSIEPVLFCGNDRGQKLFKADPQADITAIKNPNGLILEKDANGNLFFVPLKQQLTASKQFGLELGGVAVNLEIVVADASFTMNLVQQIDPATGAVTDVVLQLAAKKADADNYSWVVTAGNRPFTSDKPKFGLSYRRNDIGQGQELKIELTVAHKVPGVETCSDRKDYVLTAAIFRNHLGKGEFDNVTPE
ncbi:PKD domain-containing protein [Foetidibacter luteolus]|uniref:PKD domain-containing protein n=1 Tax=Foetidibacter luteolus TaxID=2608880 RepID=UPI00129BACE9|nr:PKD domain-containing protein [Foetidibacter luteolus]